MSRYKPIAVRLPNYMVEEMDELILRGIFRSRGEVIRTALRLLFFSLEEVGIVKPRYGSELERRKSSKSDIDVNVFNLG